MFKSTSVQSLRLIVAICCLVPLAILSGCGGDVRMSRLAGTWELNLQSSDAIVDHLLDGQIPEDASFMQKLAVQSAKNFAKTKLNELAKKTSEVTDYSMTLQFNTDGTWSSETNFPMAKGKKSGLWKVIEVTEDSMEISCQWTDKKSGKSDNLRTKVTFIEPTTITLVPPNMAGTEMELTFDRQPAK